MLSTEYSSFDDIEVRQRFGVAMDVQAQADLVNQINGAVLMQAIRKLRQAALEASTVVPTFSLTPPTNVPLILHLQGFDFFLEQAKIEIIKRTYVGTVRALITSDSGLRVLRANGATVVDRSVAGPYYAGDYKGAAIYYVPPAAGILQADEMIVVHRGDNWFESPIVYAPYLPVTVNVADTTAFRYVVSAGHSAAIEAVVPGYAQLIRFTS
jgi:hypothetical protein